MPTEGINTTKLKRKRFQLFDAKAPNRQADADTSRKRTSSKRHYAVLLSLHLHWNRT